MGKTAMKRVPFFLADLLLCFGVYASGAHAQAPLIIEGINPGQLKTQSDVFIAADGYMYFQGTDQAVWRVNSADSSDRTNFGGPAKIKTKSNIFVADSRMFFRGTDDKVWQMNTDGSGLTNPGKLKTQSNIFVAADGYMYFQGTDQAVWRVNIANPNDRTNFGGPNRIKTKSDVFVAGNRMFFRGTDDKVWQMNSNGSGLNNVGGFKTQSDVFYSRGAIYFQGTDQKVWQYYLIDGPREAYAHAAAEALQGWYTWSGDFIGTKGGLWKDTGFWNSANALNALIDYMALTKSRSYLNVVANTFDKLKSNNFINDYYDDVGWWALTWINAYDLTKDARHLDMAKTIFQHMTGGWDDVCSGGLYWQNDHSDGHGHSPYKNAIPNELFLTIAVRLYQRTGTQAYLTWATREWAWFQKSGMINSRHLVNDGLDTNCKNDGNPTFTYNQGVILGGLADLTSATRDASYITTAHEIANAAIKTLVDANGVLTEVTVKGDPGSDLPQFKGVFIRNLGYLFSFDRQPNYMSFIQNSAQSLVQKNRSFTNQFGYFWSGPVDKMDPARQTSALDALNAAMRVSGVKGVSGVNTSSNLL
jgi:predicted alpha-1,6-mannanase (GH76 family)